MPRVYTEWGQPGDFGRKLRHDSGGRDVGDPYFGVQELSLIKAMKQLAEELPEMTPAQRRIAMVLIGVMVVSLVSGCTASPGVTIDQGDHPQGTATTIGATHGVPVVEPTFVNTLSPDPVIKGTPVPSTPIAPPEVKPSPVVTRTPEVRIDSGGAMTPEEMVMFQQQDKNFLAQCEYWGNAPIPAVNLETCRNGTLIAHIMIDKEGGDMGVAYEAPGENELYAFPWGPNGPIQIPATGYVDGLPKKGAGPLRLTLEGSTANGVHYRLGWKDHKWVRVDDSGKIIEQINDQGMWEAMGPNIQEAVEVFNLNPERLYSMEGQYLVDGYNQAKMAKWENGVWIDTTLEEKYAHLITVEYKKPAGFGAFAGNSFIDGYGGAQDLNDIRYQNVNVCGNSTGNLWSRREVIDGLGVETDVIYGEYVYRNEKGELKMLTLRTDVLDPEATEQSVYITMPVSDENWCVRAGSAFARAVTPEDVKQYYGPGVPVYIVIAFEMPEQMPLPSSQLWGVGKWMSNIRNRANQAYWSTHKEELRAIARDLLIGGDNVPAEKIIPAQFVMPIMPLEEALALDAPSWNE